MIRQSIEKLRSERGVMSRMVALLLVLVGVMLVVVVLVPAAKWMNAQAELHSCEAAMDTAWRKMAEDYMLNGSDKIEEVKEAVGYAMNGWDDICPSGGKVYLVSTRSNNKSEQDKAEGKLPYELVCGKHDRDSKRRTRLNADDLLRQLETALRQKKKDGEKYPESITLTYNSKPLEAVLVDEPSGLRRGTSTTSGLEKEVAVAYYSIVGHSDFGKDSGAKKGRIWYFSFADRDHCANWRINEGWTGDSYEGMSQ